MEQSQKNSTEVLLGPKKLTPDQIMALPPEEEQAYIRGLTAKEFGDFVMGDFIANLNHNATESVKNR